MGAVYNKGWLLGVLLLLSWVNVANANTWYLAPETFSGGVSEQGVDLGSGKLLRNETDLALSGLSFRRTYPSAGAVDSELGGWQHNYSQRLDQRIDYNEYRGLKSPLYNSERDACANGWKNIRTTAYTGLMSTATAQHSNGLCLISKNNKVLARLPLLRKNGHHAAIHTLNRPDGSRYTFYQQGGVWKTTTGDALKLVKTGNRWQVTLLNDSREYYDTAGRLLSILNPQGQETRLIYLNGRLDKVIGPFGRQLKFFYANNRLDKVQSPDGIVKYRYANGYLSSVIKRDGKIHRYSTDTQGRLKTATNPAGQILASYAYDAQSRIAHVQGQGGRNPRQITYSRPVVVTDDTSNGRDRYQFTVVQGRMRVTRLIDKGGKIEQRGYGGRGNLTRQVSKQGKITLTNYNNRNLPYQVTDSAGTPKARTTSTQWHPQFRKPVKITEPGKVTTISYDSKGLERSRTVSGGGLNRTTTTAYNTKGQPTSRTAPNGATTTVGYDSQGNSTGSTNALGQSDRVTQTDPAGRPLKIFDKNNRLTVNQYQDGRLFKSTTQGLATRYRYDNAGRQKQITRPDGSYELFDYDSRGNRYKTTDDRGNVTTNSFDANATSKQAPSEMPRARLPSGKPPPTIIKTA